MKENYRPDRRAQVLTYVGIIVTALIVIPVVCFICLGTETTILLVRHADRQGSEDALSAAGIARAQELAHLLEKSRISAIYTSEAIRTKQTAAPTATRLGLTPLAVPAADVAGIVRTIRNSNAGQAVLIVGHSNTVPQIIAEFGGPVIRIGDDEFDNLYVLTLRRYRWQRVNFIHLQYGAPSP